MSAREIGMSQLIAPAFIEAHYDALGKRHRHYWLKGGRGSGKSSFISVEIALGLIRDATASAVVFRKHANTLADSVYKQIGWALWMCGCEEEWRGWKSPLRYEHRRTGQEILFRGADDPLKVKSITPAIGQKFRHMWLEELAEYNGMDDVQSILQSIARGTDEFTSWYSYNPPKTAGSWVNAEDMTERDDRYTHASTYLTMPEAWLGKVFFEEAQHIKVTNERAYRNAYLGEVTGTGGNVFDNVEIRAIAQDERGRFDRMRCGLDFGFAKDPDAMVRVHYDARQSILYILDEIYASGQALETLADRALGLAGRGVVTCDSEDPRMIDGLRRRGVQAMPAKKGPGSVEHGIRWLQERGKIVIDSKRAANAAREFRALEYQQDKYGNFMAKVKEGDDHAVDAVRYAVEELSTARVVKTINRAALGI